MSRRVRRRYLSLTVVSEKPVDQEDVTSAVWNAIVQLFGEYGASQVNLRLIEYNQQEGQAIVRCSHKALEMLRVSIASVTEINGKSAAIHVIGVSGTLRALRKKTLS